MQDVLPSLSFPREVLLHLCRFLDEKELTRFLLTQRGCMIPPTSNEDGPPSLFLSPHFWRTRAHSLYASHCPVQTDGIRRLQESYSFWKAVCLSGYLSTCPHCGSMDPPRVTAIHGTVESICLGCSTPRFNPHTLTRFANAAYRAATLVPCLVPGFARSQYFTLESLRLLYSSRRDGGSLSTLRRALRGKANLFAAPTILLVHCIHPASAFPALVGALIPCPWPFPETTVHAKQVDLFRDEHPELCLFAFTSAQNSDPLVRTTLGAAANAATPEDLRTQHYFGVDPKRGLWIGGDDYGSAALSLNTDLSRASSWPSSQFQLTHCLLGTVNDNTTSPDFTIRFVEVWSPYWALHPLRRHPRIVAATPAATARPAVASPPRYPKCLGDARFVGVFGQTLETLTHSHHQPPAAAHEKEAPPAKQAGYQNHFEELPGSDTELHDGIAAIAAENAALSQETLRSFVLVHAQQRSTLDPSPTTLEY